MIYCNIPTEQACIWLDDPAHVAPHVPAHVRVLVIVPDPHVVLQVLHADHVVQAYGVPFVLVSDFE